MHFKLRTIFF